MMVCPCHPVSPVISFPKLPKPLGSTTSFTPVAVPEQELSPPFQPKLIPGQFLKTYICQCWFLASLYFFSPHAVYSIPGVFIAGHGSPDSFFSPSRIGNLSSLLLLWQRVPVTPNSLRTSSRSSLSQFVFLGHGSQIWVLRSLGSRAASAFPYLC